MVTRSTLPWSVAQGMLIVEQSGHLCSQVLPIQSSLQILIVLQTVHPLQPISALLPLFVQTALQTALPHQSLSALLILCVQKTFLI